MYSITYYHPRTRVLRAMSTPARVVAFDVYAAMARRGFIARVWHQGRPVHIARRPG